MKLVFKTNKNSYLIRLPNYFDVTTVQTLFDEVRFDLDNDETILEHHFYGDDMLTLEERKQLDLYGKVSSSPKELSLN